MLWVGTRNGLIRLNPDGSGHTTFTHDPDNKKSLSHNVVLSIYEDLEGRFWVGTGMLEPVGRTTGSFKSFLEGDPNGGRRCLRLQMPKTENSGGDSQRTGSV